MLTRKCFISEEAFEKYLKEAALNKHYKLPSGCWMWSGSVGTDGYGKTKWKGKTIRAHRLVYMLTKGEIAEGLFVLHTCDKPDCVNPEHLWLGTHAENEADKDAKGRRRNKHTIKTMGRTGPERLRRYG